MREKDVLSRYQMQSLQVRTVGICILFLNDEHLIFSIFADFRIPAPLLELRALICALLVAVINGKRNTTNYLFIFLGLIEHVYSNFPFATSVGNRCFEEKHVFIASKTLRECSLQMESNWHRPDFNHSCMILYRLNWIALLLILSYIYLILICCFSFLQDTNVTRNACQMLHLTAVLVKWSWDELLTILIFKLHSVSNRLTSIGSHVPHSLLF